MIARFARRHAEQTQASFPRALFSRLALFHFLLPAILLCCACTATTTRNPATAVRVKPNVLLILIDDLRSDLGADGNHVHTPNIDALAARGMRFERAYAQSTICNPSRASLLTGLRPDRTGVHNNSHVLRDTMPDAVTLPELFRDHGYFTARFGKVFHQRSKLERPEAWDLISYGKTTTRGREGEGRNLTDGAVKWCRWLAAEGSDEDQPDGQNARQAAAFLADAPAEPFFLAIGFYKPHDPWVAPAPYFEPYPLGEIRLHRDPPDATPIPAEALGGPWHHAFAQFTDRERRELQRAYYASTSFMDAQVGIVLDALKRAGLEKNTIVVLASDHGYHLGERGWWHKNSLFEVSARAPLIVEAPGMRAAGRSSQRLVELVDIFPTVAGLAGIEISSGLDGSSFAPLLDDPGIPWKRAAYTQVLRPDGFGRSVRTARWRYTEWDVANRSRELYDHDADPGEFTNLAGSAEHADVARRLRRLLESSREKSAR